jgi:hypothetical protein
VGRWNANPAGADELPEASLQVQRLAWGTPAMTMSTCMPQPRQVVLPQVEQSAGLHMGAS